MAKKQSILILSLVTVLLALALVVGATYALFSTSSTVTNHLEAGTLKLQLYRTRHEQTALQADGTLETKTFTNEAVDFTHETEKNIFDIQEGDLVVPGSKYSADMRIDNVGNVAFGYWIEVVLKVDGQLVNPNLALAEQLKVTVAPDGQTQQSKALSEGLTVGSDAAPVAKIAADSNASFTVTVEFLNITTDKTTNNAAQEGVVEFDIIVHALQVTAL